MSLDVYLIDPTATYEVESLYSSNITHNLGKMADAAGIYEALWRPHRLVSGYNIPENDYNAEYAFEEKQTIIAKHIIPIIEKGLKDLLDRPDYYRQFNAANGWGLYRHFVPWVQDYLVALKQYPEAIVKVSR
jgi:hypothetical protein